MPSILVPSVPFYRNPRLRPGLAALVEFLMGRDYSSHAIGRIFAAVAASGTLEGSLVEEEDMAEAEAIFVDNLPELDPASEAWDRDQSLILDCELLRRNEHPFPIPAVGDDDRDFDAAMAALEGLPLPEAPDLRDPRDWPDIPPVSGGAPYEPTDRDRDDWLDYRAAIDARPAGPTEADWAEYHATMDAIDRRREVEGLARVHRALYGQDEPFHA